MLQQQPTAVAVEFGSVSNNSQYNRREVSFFGNRSKHGDSQVDIHVLSSSQPAVFSASNL